MNSKNKLTPSLILIGYRGCGKSTIAKLLSEKLQIELYSSDIEIEKFIGVSISEYLTKNSWDSFRDIESKVIKTLSLMPHSIIDCGGGVVERVKNMEILQSVGVIFFLSAPIEVIAKRLSSKTDRPSLTGKDFIQEIDEVLTRRTPLYKRYSHHIIDTSSEDLEHICDQIISIYQSKLSK